ncbi:hypothetical protein [Aeromicrobium sp. HA]|uniref:hypothetical protein n=1 Tax=Aeromicrobium sp. HA TaxID=3009077 RepID=UPI0022B04A8E|nr:hypothetical protein [Aeromicrobium sp. HA]
MSTDDYAGQTAPPKPPTGLKREGRRLWRSVTDAFDLAVHEEQLLAEACRQADRLAELDRAIRQAPLTVVNSRGDEVTHPLRVEARMLAAQFARTLASLRMPDVDEDADAASQRPQRRGGARGTYGRRTA